MMIQINSVYPLIYKVYFLENVHTSPIKWYWHFMPCFTI